MVPNSAWPGGLFAGAPESALRLPPSGVESHGVTAGSGACRARPGGRTESSWKRLSDMDVARAAMGQGWPTVAGLWNDDGVSEPWRSQGRMNGRRVLVTFARKSYSPGRAKPKTSTKTRQFGTDTKKHKFASPVSNQHSPQHVHDVSQPIAMDGQLARLWL